MAESVLLVDASSLIYRAWFALPASIAGPGGRPVNAVHGFLDMIARLIAERRPSGLVCCFDDDWRPQWRVALLPEYKANRVAGDEDDAEDTPEDQIPVARDLLEAAGIACAGAAGFEAEDVIGTIAARLEGRARIEIVSGDRDLFALVRDPDVVVLYPRRGVSDLEVVDEAWIESRYQIPGRAYFDFAVLRGDPSDGLPGVPGIGEKTAAALVRAHGDIRGVLAAARGATGGPLAKVAAHAGYVRRAARVVAISRTAPAGRIRHRLPSGVPEAFVDAGRRAGVGGPASRLAAAVAHQ